MNGIHIKRTCILLCLFLTAGLSAGSVAAQTNITSLSQITDAKGHYKIAANITYNSSTNHPGVSTFNGTLEANINSDTKMPYRISGITAPLFDSLTGTVRNLVLENVAISGHTGTTGAIADTASDSARIYNVGILSGSVGGTGYTGGLVGLLIDSARVVNCYSYATITGGSTVGGIVGYNNVATTAATIATGTMVMNCMFYGDITGGTTVSPIYGGQNINNLNSGGLTTFNYYSYESLTGSITSGKYNCALAVEEKYLNRFEFYRLLLNSNKKLAAFYATGSVDNGSQMLKWVLETADRTIDNPKPYPILKAQGYYPSIVNPDTANAPDSATVGRNHGGKLGRKLSVTITQKAGKTDGGQSWPTDAASDVQTTTLTLTRTDKDFDRFNYNYDKVQLPYYNDVGTGNYTENRVVTGWKITSITGGTEGTYTAADEWGGYNFADRNCTNKDKYSVSGRVFSQGAYWDVPYGVTAITIEPYWGYAAFLADKNYDAVFKTDYTRQDVSQTGTQVGNSTKFNDVSVKTSVSDALGTITTKGPTVYDNAIVLVGNFHQNGIPSQGTEPFTIMSVDLDNDHEPDYSMIYHHKGKLRVSPIRFDFLNIPGTAQAQKPNGASDIFNMAIIHPSAWFEITNTSSIYFSQLEYEDLVDNENRTDGPLILQGGVIDQFVSTNNKTVPGKTTYMHLGGNVWFKEFNMGTHGDGSQSTPHPPVSVTGGEYDGFYLTGIFNQDAKVRTDNAECYISGGYFHEAAGAAQEAINGNVRWQIYNADIDNFFGGGTNGATGKNIKGDVTIDIFNSHVTTYCGGPKFGNMESGKKVTTNADGCVFGTFFGAGYGGTAYSRKKYYDLTTTDWSGWASKYISDRGKYFDGATTNCPGDSKYGKKGIGVATDFDYEFFVWSSGKTGGRFYVKFASFSLAQCNDVESNLKNCTITGNFYGGGSLGKVVGSVTSVLDSCTVNGDVYGAGFSAEVPTLQVRDGGFTTAPNYNSASGMFEPGVFSGTTEFHWKHVNSLSNNSSGTSVSDNGDTNFVHTTVELTTLGTVNGDISLTLKGTTVVTGNVFGGGEESAVTGDVDVQVTLEGETKVTGDVFGGGNQGEVEGNTQVILKD